MFTLLAPLVLMAAPLGPGAVESVVNAHQDDVLACYAPVAQRDPRVQGRIRLQWTLGRDGTVTAVSVVEDTLGNDAVASCLKKRARAWRFPAPEVGVAVVAYTFYLRVG